MCLCECMCMYPCAGAFAGQKCMLRLSELELQVFSGLLIGMLGPELQFSV